MINLYKSRIFIRKDFIIESSYKMQFLLKLLNSFFPVISFFFVGKLVDSNHFNEFNKYGSNYFSFVLIGVAFTRYFQLAVDTFSENIKRAQAAGCLEAILSSQTDPKAVVIMSSFYSFISAGIQLLFMFLIGTVLFGFDWTHINLMSTFVVLLISLAIFISLGILSAAGTIIFKQGEPFGWVFGALSALLGGALFPVEVMPSWLQIVANAFPVTHSLEALRLTMLKGEALSAMPGHIIILLAFAVILFPLSLKVFERSVEMGKKNGTLMQY